MFEKWFENKVKKALETKGPLTGAISSAGDYSISSGGYRVAPARNGWILFSSNGELPRVATSDAELIEQLTADLAYSQLKDDRITIKVTPKLSVPQHSTKGMI